MANSLLVTKKTCSNCRFCPNGRCYSNSHVRDLAQEENKQISYPNSCETTPDSTCKHWMLERRIFKYVG